LVLQILHSLAGTYTVKYTTNEDATNGLCSDFHTEQIVINSNVPVVPTFNSVSAVCSGSSIAALPTSSTNATPINGTWSPAIDNTATTVYTFTPEAGVCATIKTMEIEIKQLPVATISASGTTTFCEGTPVSVTLTSSSSSPGDTYEWIEDFTVIGATNTKSVSQVGSYTLKVTGANGCFKVSLPTVVSVSPSVTPTFDTPVAICSGATPSLPLTSTNSATGTWSPVFAPISVETEYTFTATSGCFTTKKVKVPVNAKVEPTFDTPVAICSGATASLPLTSINSAVGTWSPSFAPITAETEYTFTPTSGCFTTKTLKVPVTAKETPKFTIKDLVCKGSTAIVLPVSSSNTTPITGTWSTGTPSATVTSVATSTIGATVYTFTPASTFCANNYTKTVTVSSCAGIEEATISSFTIYPNPSNDVISVSFSELASRTGTIKFIAADGKLIESRDYNNSSVETFDVKSLNPGIYFLQIDNSIEKVVVQ